MHRTINKSPGIEGENNQATNSRRSFPKCIVER